MRMLDSGSRVLVVVVARIGDTLLATPAIRALRRAAGHVTVLAHPKRMEVLQNIDFIDQLGVLTKQGAFLRRFLPGPRYDLAVCYGSDPSLLKYCVGCATDVICFDYPELRDTGGSGVTRVPPPPDQSVHAVSERLALAEAAGAVSESHALAYTVSGEERVDARDWVSLNIPARHRRLIGLQPFSFHTKAHRDWPLDRFGVLASRFIETYPDTHIVVFGDEATRDRCQGFGETLRGRCTIVAGQFSLRQSAAVMEILSLYVGVDTGPTHIAGALGIPMVALYHPAYPARNLRPLSNERCIAIEAPAVDGVPIEDVKMSSVEFSPVWNAAQRLVSGGTA